MLWIGWWPEVHLLYLALLLATPYPFPSLASQSPGGCNLTPSRSSSHWEHSICQSRWQQEWRCQNSWQFCPAMNIGAACKPPLWTCPWESKAALNATGAGIGWDRSERGPPVIRYFDRRTMIASLPHSKLLSSLPTVSAVPWAHLFWLGSRTGRSLEAELESLNLPFESGG